MLAPVAVLLGLQGCRSEPERILEPESRHEQRAGSSVFGAHWARPDDVLSAIGDQLPGFGGLYQDSLGLVVYLTDPETQKDGAENVVRPILGQAQSAGQFALSALAALPIRFRRGTHTFSELRQWKGNLYRHDVPKGTVEVGIDKRTNQVLVGVATDVAKSVWNDMIKEERVPATAIRIERMPVPVPNTTVQDSIRPTGGGIQIIRYGTSSGTNATCTLGSNVTIPYSLDPDQLYFVTASHCSQNMCDSDVVNSTWYQSLISTGHAIATGEEMDPQPVTNGNSPHPSGWPTITCPSAHLCRWSDATLVRYTNSSSGTRGRLIVATSVVYPNVAAVSSYKQMGWPRCFYDCPSGPIYKTGRTTGTTSGSFNTVDLDYYPDSATYWNVSGVRIRGNWVMVAQTRISSMVADGGDSGSPVWQYDSVTDLTNPWLMGIYHAGNCSSCSGNRYFSPTANVANDLAGGYFNMSWY